MNQARQRTDVDREFALLFMMFDENKSWYLEENIQSYYNSSEPLLRDAEFQKSNKMYGESGRKYMQINPNYVFCCKMLKSKKSNYDH